MPVELNPLRRTDAYIGDEHCIGEGYAVKTTFAFAALLGLAAIAGCAKGEDTDASAQNSTTPLDRLLIGKAQGYEADKTLDARMPELKASQAKRREVAWKVIQKAIEPVAIDEEGKPLPRFQTWYGKDEIVPMFEHILMAQTDDERRAHKPPTPEQIQETFEWQSKRATTLASFSADRLAARKAEIAAEGTSSLGGQDRVLMSPTLVGHLLTHYEAMLKCIGNVPAADAPPTNDNNFAPCIGEEFPADAVLIKARWMPDSLPLFVNDTSATALTEALTSGEWPVSDHIATPTAQQIYSMKLPNGMVSRLVALHVATKETRDWVWTSMFWSDTPNTDFGADRPAAMTGPWGGYKMCVAVDYDELDNGEYDSQLDPTLAAAFAATRKFGARSWCSNPYLEQGPHNAKTNCIGCHQHGGTLLTTEAILEGPDSTPDGSRGRVRTNFPADYTFITSSGLELASRIQAKYDQLVPPPPAPVEPTEPTDPPAPPTPVTP